MILSLTDVTELKKEVEQQFSVKVHFCDSCGGQSFTVESPTEELKEFISTFFFFMEHVALSHVAVWAHV